MTKTLGTNAKNDLYLGPDGNVVMLSGIAAVLAACASVARSQPREMVLAQQAGLPNFQTVWVGVPNLEIWKQYLRKQLENVSGVVEVQALGAEIRGNTVSYSATIKTQYGEGTLNG